MAQPKLLIDDADWKEIQQLALERGTRGQTLIRDAVLNWLRHEKGLQADETKRGASDYPYRARHRIWHDKLEELLASADSAAVQTILERFADTTGNHHHPARKRLASGE